MFERSKALVSIPLFLVVSTEYSFMDMEPGAENHHLLLHSYRICCRSIEVKALRHDYDEAGIIPSRCYRQFTLE